MPILPPAVRRWLALVLLIAGVALYAAATFIRPDPLPQLVAVAIAAVAATAPPVARRIDRLLEKVRRPSPRAAAVTALCVGALGVIYLFATAALQGRDLL